MSKIYFAQYLPESEDGNADDLYIFKIGDKWSEPREFDSLIGAAIQEVKLVKLWLCSRELQIGDLAFIPNEEIAGTVIDEDDLAHWRSSNAFRLIGRISKKAVWVKDGDEFDEYEVKGFTDMLRGQDKPFGYEEEDFHSEIPINRESINRGIVNTIYVLNHSCKHFH